MPLSELDESKLVCVKTIFGEERKNVFSLFSVFSFAENCTFSLYHCYVHDNSIRIVLRLFQVLFAYPFCLGVTYLPRPLYISYIRNGKNVRTNIVFALTYLHFTFTFYYSIDIFVFLLYNKNGTCTIKGHLRKYCYCLWQSLSN